MKVTEHIRLAAGRPLVSFEILPPLKGKSIQQLYQHLDGLMSCRPAFINVTYHRAEQIFKAQADGTYRQVEIRKRPGTVGICAAIQNHYQVDAIPHLICGGFSKEETENALIDLHYLGIHNVLALRGDAAANQRAFVPHRHGHQHSLSLVNQIIDLNKGKYLEEESKDEGKTDFCVGVAGYPEKHFEAANADMDLTFLKAKVDAGAEYVITQMFFDNQKFLDFRSRCVENGINVPLIPGLKPITRKSQIHSIPGIFHVDIPSDLALAINACKTDAECEAVGAEWLEQQCAGLIRAGVPVLHFYTLGMPGLIQNVVQSVL
ncbi:MAG TPA: methylenetetrahydrofolate reductase [Edaphocola sp.]|nr:methylenetetrahydrofolate reductase [Edaphocola sp.]